MFLHHCSVLIIFSAILPFSQPFDYKDALSKSILYFESQRSGHLPNNQRATWRHDSGLSDGLEQGVSPFYQTPIIVYIDIAGGRSEYNFHHYYITDQTLTIRLCNKQTRYNYFFQKNDYVKTENFYINIYLFDIK